MKILSLTVVMLLFTSKIIAQQAIVSIGNDITGVGGSISYSIGQVNQSFTNGSNGSVSQGVHQAFEISTLGNNDFPEIKAIMSVYPNPATAFVNLKIENQSLKNLYYQLFDQNGKQLESNLISSLETQISIDKVSNAIYFLTVFDQSKPLKTFKIIKN